MLDFEMSPFVCLDRLNSLTWEDNNPHLGNEIIFTSSVPRVVVVNLIPKKFIKNVKAEKSRLIL